MDVQTGQSADILEQQRQLALSQWQAQQVQLAQLEELNQQNRGQEQPPPPPSQPAIEARPKPDLVEQLKQLAELRGQGILTEEEFNAQKRKLLDGS